MGKGYLIRDEASAAKPHLINIHTAKCYFMICLKCGKHSSKVARQTHPTQTRLLLSSCYAQSARTERTRLSCELHKLILSKNGFENDNARVVTCVGTLDQISVKHVINPETSSGVCEWKKPTLLIRPPTRKLVELKSKRLPAEAQFHCWSL